MPLHDAERIKARLSAIEDPTGFLVGLFESAPFGLALWDAKGYVVLTNQAFYDLFRNEPPPEYSVLEDEHLTRVGTRAFVDRAYAGETVHLPVFWYDPREDTRFTITEGRRVAIALTLFPLRSPSGAIEYVVATYRDETERALDAERLARSEARFRKLAEAGIIGVAVVDDQGLVRYANDTILATTQRTREELERGLRLPDVVDMKRLSRADRLAGRDLRAHGTAGPWETTLLRRDGARVPVLVGAARGDDASEIIAFVLELTARKQADAQRASVMEASLDAVILLDAAGRVVELNPTAEHMFGFARGEAHGLSLAELVLSPEARAGGRGIDPLGADFLGRRVELLAARRDGTSLPVEIAVVPIQSAGPSSFTCYIRDLTERQRAAQAELLQREKEAAQVAHRELEAFSYSVAHDLRNPLRGINGFAAILLEEHGVMLDEAGRGYLARIIAGATRMGHIIDSLLALARVSRAGVERRPTDLAAVGRLVTEQLRARDPDRVVDFVVADELMVEGDPSLLRVVLENLLGNAWKFTRRRSRARIELGRTLVGGEVCYFVKDDGAGFDMRFVDQLFKAFKRLHASDEFDGTGVGLATVERVVHRHGGRVWAEAREDEGATFYFTLPRPPS